MVILPADTFPPPDSVRVKFPCATPPVDTSVLDEAGVLFDQEEDAIEEEEQVEEFREFIENVRPEDFAQ